jgi:hypothetical protein
MNHLRAALPCGLLLLAACGEERSSESDVTSASDLEVAMSALENPIISCQIQAGECVQKAADVTALQACQSGVGDCLKAASERVQTVADGVGACRDEERKCLRGAGAQGGSCVDGFGKCVEALAATSDAGSASGFPTFPRADAGLPSFPGNNGPGFPPLPGRDAGSADDAGVPVVSPLPTFPGRGDGGLSGLPTPPTFPGFGDGGLPGFPGGGRPQLPGNDCLEGLRACAAKPDAKLFECTAETRECLAAAAFSPLAFP